jgi:hypothetical protein
MTVSYIETVTYVMIDARIIVDQYKTLLYKQRNNVTRHSLNVMNHCIKVNKNHSINVRRYCKGME